MEHNRLIFRLWAAVRLDLCASVSVRGDQYRRKRKSDGINLGSFTFSNITTDYTGTFTLTINFTRPNGSADPAETVTLVADANSNGQNDMLTIDFPSASQYTFTGSDGTGVFNFRVEDVSDFRNGSHTDTVNLIGDITGAALTRSTQAAVPEPASLLLFGSVLGGLAVGAKKKFSSNS